MTRVDFYIHDSLSQLAQNVLMCRITEKAWKKNHKIFVRCLNEKSVKEMDDLLWSFSAESFVPHECQSENHTAPIIIGDKLSEAIKSDLLVNLGEDVPTTVSKFQRVVEPTGYDESSRNSARVKYKYYQDRGFPIFTHKINLS
ncbi:MAG: DNA polymerase III subunit chi [Gammaproteobacteria bacterium]